MDFNWDTILFHDLNWTSAGEIAVRTLIMFTMILLFLRFSGKKGVRQLSLFEVAVIIGLGSAAGDPMFNEDSAIVPAVVVFVSILLFYRGLTYLAGKSEWFESVLEGDPLYIVEDGQFVIDHNEPMFAKDEFFAEMRQQNIEHVGQVRTAILETNGVVSFFFYADEDVRPGLPVLPKIYNARGFECVPGRQYACTFCAHVLVPEAQKMECPRCKRKEWVEAVNMPRIT